jgi:hypothetical protein
MSEDFDIGLGDAGDAIDVGLPIAAIPVVKEKKAKVIEKEEKIQTSTYHLEDLTDKEKKAVDG